MLPLPWERLFAFECATTNDFSLLSRVSSILTLIRTNPSSPFRYNYSISSYFIPESRTKLKYSSPFDERGTGKEEGIRPRVRIEHLDIQLFIEDIQRRVDLTGRLVDQTKFLSRAERVEIVRTTVNRLVGCECRANWSES